MQSTQGYITRPRLIDLCFKTLSLGRRASKNILEYTDSSYTLEWTSKVHIVCFPGNVVVIN